jgi:hypothetical protein
MKHLKHTYEKLTKAPQKTLENMCTVAIANICKHSNETLATYV